MALVNLELRLSRYGSIWDESVLIGDATRRSREITGWQQADSYRYVLIPNFPDDVSPLKLYIGCVGIAGGTATCEVFVNGKSVGKVTARAEDTNYTEGKFNLKVNQSA
ncbi:hypothetical protein HRH25_23570 [Flavisolibacter sp. BT320]|nr:hypothetical protein [Flavisolibacter longurius]